MRYIPKYIFWLPILLLVGCAVRPLQGVYVVDNFQLDKYLGTWHEVARLDNNFERNLEDVSATYEKQNDGSIKVINRGYDSVTKQYKSAVGKAYFVDQPSKGALKVSFFGPFYSGYNILAVDKDYQSALVAGKDWRYLWLLSRKTTLTREQESHLLSVAENYGFDVDKLLWRQPN